MARAVRTRRADIDAVIRGLGDRQYGIVARWQLLDAGLRPSAIGARTGDERLRTLHAGVYAVGHRTLGADGRRLAAVLACGPAAALADEDTLALHGLRAATGGPVHVVLPHGSRRGRHRGIAVHRRTLAPEQLTVVDRIPTVTVAVALVGAAARLSRTDLELAVDQAIAADLFDLRAIERARARGRPGAAALGTVLRDRVPGSHRSRRELERRMLRLVREHGLPIPEVNKPLVDLKVVPDLLWRRQRVVVELDSRTYHRDLAAFEADREKTAKLQAAGYRVWRFTWRQVADDPDQVIAWLRPCL